MEKARHKNGEGIVKRAKTLRQTGSMTERILWKALREHPEQQEIKFRYQHPLSRYVVDFACLSARLVVEIDGLSHDGTDREDTARQAFIEGQGYMVIRFSNEDVLRNVGSVAETVRHQARERLKDMLKLTPPRKR